MPWVSRMYWLWGSSKSWWLISRDVSYFGDDADMDLFLFQWKYSWFTMFQVYSKVIQIYTHTHTHTHSYRILNIAGMDIYQNLPDFDLERCHHLYHGFCGHYGVMLSANIKGTILPQSRKSSKSIKIILVCIPCPSLFITYLVKAGDTRI